MSAPRQVLPGSTYLVTRRCSERRFFLSPSAIVNQVFSYCLAYATQQTGVLVHAYVALSNHWHAVITDPDGRLPEFMAHVNKLVGKCINTHLGRWESLWSPEKYSSVRLETEEDVFAKLLYVLGNPVEAALVESSNQWPGAISGPRACAAAPRTIPRPDIFFRPDGEMPTAVPLQMTVPPCFSSIGRHKLASQLAQQLKDHEADLLAKHAAEGRELLGRLAVLCQDPFDCPQSLAPRRNLNPRVACRDKWRRVEALCRLKEFLQAYREAWLAFKSGVKDVVFPAGTYWMCRHAGCPSASPG